MNIEEACARLDISVDFLEDDIDEYTVKQAYLNKQYRKYALLSHPDKNGSAESFQKVKEAYDILSEKLNDTPDVSIAKEFPFFEENREMIDVILDKMFLICETQMIKWLENVELRKYKFASNILKKFRHIFRLSDAFYLSLVELDKKMESLEIKIEPTLDDLMDDMIYSLWIDEKQYLIPLWHHELVYDHFGKDLVVKIEPVSDLWIDSENHVHSSITCSLAYLFELSMHRRELEVWFGKKKLYLNPCELLLKRKQTYTWKNEGISKIQDDIYDSSERGDLVLELTID